MYEDDFIYEVHSDHGAAIFHNEEDAINALWMIGLYHDITIDHERIKRALNQDSFYEHFPIAIVKTE